MLSVDEALKHLAEIAKENSITELERLDANAALGRVLAQDCIAPINVPPADNSAMDGYALYLDDNKITYPITLPISQRVPAGAAPAALKTNTAARIFTGAEIPEGANCVVLQENCDTDEHGNVLIKEGLRIGANIRRLGQDIRKNSVAMAKGIRLNAASIGLLHSLGINSVSVLRKLKVTVFSTGDELIPAGQTLKSGQIYDSNRHMISAQLRALDVDIILSRQIPDSPEALRNAFIKAAQSSDLIVSSGGVSVGEEDHVKAIVSEIGNLNFWKVHMKPGKPLAYGQINIDDKASPCHFLGLPGNPVSSFITFHLFGKALVKALSGRTNCIPQAHFHKANFEVEKADRRPEFIRVKIGPKGLERFNNQSSGVLSSLVWADALAHIPTNTEIKLGDFVSCFPLDT